MPYNGSGVYSLPAGYQAIDGETALASQHTPPLEDIKGALDLALLRDGRAPMSGLLTLFGNATASLHATPKQQVESLIAAAIEDFIPLPIAFLAVGDNTANDNTPFANMVAANIGKDIDLGGDDYTYYVPAGISGDVQFYNGKIRTSTGTTQFPKTPFSNPLAGGSALNMSVAGHERPYASGLIYRPGSTADTREWIAAFTQHKKHVTQPGDGVAFYRSLSAGAQWKDGEFVTLASGEGILGGSLVGIYGVDNAGIGGKYGFLASSIDAGSTIRNYFIYSYGNEWLAEQLTGVTLGPFFHGRVLNVPAAEGGSTTTWIASGYGGGCQIVKTTNAFSAASTTDYMAKADGADGISDATECVIAKTAANQYYLVARRDGGGNLHSAFSAAPLTAAAWGAWTDTNIPCGANPLQIVDKWGRFFFYVFSRRGTPIDGYPEETLLVCSIKKSEWHANGGRFLTKAAFTVVMQGLESFTGYGGYAENSLGQPLFIGNQNETLTGSSNLSASSVFAITPHRAPSQAPAIITRRRSGLTLNPDPALRLTPFGKAFVGLGGTRKMISASLSYSQGTGTADFTYQELDQKITDTATYSPRNAWRINNSATGAGRTFYTRFSGIEEVKRICRSGPISSRIDFVGQIPPYYRAYAYVHPGTGGSPSSALTGDPADAKQYDYVSGLFSPSAVIWPPDISAMTFGTNDDAYVDLIWLSNNSGAAFCDLTAVGWWHADAPLEIEPYGLAEEMARAANLVELLEFNASQDAIIAQMQATSGTTAVGEIEYFPKRVRPTVALANGTTAPQFVLGGASALTNIQFDRIGLRKCRVIATVASGLTTNAAYDLYWDSVSPGGILVNAIGIT